MKAVDARDALRRIRTEANAARAFFYTWDALNRARGDQGLRDAMNKDFRPDFFRSTMVAHFRMIFVSVGTIYDSDNRGKSLTVDYLIKTLDKTDGAGLSVLRARHEHVIQGMRRIRNKAIAHNDPESVDDVFKQASITPNQIRVLIDETCDALDVICTRPEYDFNRIAGGSRHTRAVASILDVLHGS